MESYLFIFLDSSTATSLAPEDLNVSTTAFEDHGQDPKGNNSGFRSEALHFEEQQSPLLFYAVLSVVFFFGIVGNTLLIIIFLLHKSMRTAPNTYILNLAVADLLITVSCATSPVLHRVGRSFPLLCQLFQVLLDSSMGVVSFTLVALSVERYFAIARPLHRKISSQKFTLSVVVLIWLLAISYVIEKMVVLNRGSGKLCIQMFNPSSFSQNYTIVDFVLLYLTPLVIISVFYILLARELYLSGRFFHQNDSNSKTPQHLKVRKRIALTILILVAMFAIFFFPFNFLSLRLYFDSGYVKNWNLSVNILFCIGCLHECLNPVVLYSLSESFRGHFNNYLFYCIFKTSVPVKNEHTSCNCSECSRKLTSHKALGSVI